MFERLYTRMTLEHLEFCHSLTHYTSVENLHSILKYGMIPTNRAIFFHPFPDHHPHHTQSSRSSAPVCIRVKKEALFMVRDLWLTPCRSVLVEKFIPRSLVQTAYLQPRKRSKHSNDWRSDQDKMDGHLTSQNDRNVPICIYDCGLVPFPVLGVSTADNGIAPPLVEDDPKVSGFKVPKSASIKEEFLDQSLWLTNMVNAEEAVKLKEFECNQCYNMVYSGQTICFSCGHIVLYGPTEMDVEILDGSTTIDDKALERAIAPEAIAAMHKQQAEARIKKADKAGKFGLLVGVKSEFSALKKVIQEMRKHRRNWDANFAEMGALCKWRKVAVPQLLGPWHPTSAWQEPDESLIPEISIKLKEKIAVMEYVDQHDAELDWGPGAREWPQRHRDAIWKLAEDWKQMHREEDRPTHRGMQAMVADAREFFPTAEDEGDESNAQVRRYIKACGELTVELGREPVAHEIKTRADALRVEDHEKLQASKYARTGQYSADSGAASSSDGQWRGHQYGTRAVAGDDAREQWGDQSWRGSWWSTTTEVPMDDHDRRNFAMPRHRDQATFVETNDNWEATRGNWRERLPANWNQVRADWNARHGGWQNFR